MNCWITSTDLGSRVYGASQSVQMAAWKSGFRKLCPLNTFIFALLHQNEGFDISRIAKFKVNKRWEKSVAEGKSRKCDRGILLISYQLPVTFSTFSLLVQQTWHTLKMPLITHHESFKLWWIEVTCQHSEFSTS